MFEFFNNLVHIRSFPRLLLKTSPDESSKQVVIYFFDLLFTPFRIGKLRDTYFAKEHTKTIDVNLSKELTIS